MSYKIKYFAVSHKGLRRKINQDNYICNDKYLINPDFRNGEIIEGEINPGFDQPFAVFDGLGGEEKGEKAALISAKVFKEFWGWKESPQGFLEVFEKANHEICRYMKENDIPAMGATSAAIRFRKYAVDIGNLGDSKIYGLSRSNLIELSVDHSIKLNSRGKPPLYQYLGIREEDMIIEPYINSFRYDEYDTYLLCSDGLTDMVTQKEIERILNTKKGSDAANELLAKALENGGKDNITFIILYLEREEAMNGKINISELWPDWEIEKAIGRGSFGTVYRAVNRKELTDNTCAIKVISIPLNESETDSLFYEGITESEARTYYREVVEDFVSEIQLMELLKDCPNVVKIIDYKVVEKKEAVGWDIYVRMELLTPLNAYLSGKKLSEEEVLKIGSDICNVLEVCGEHNIIHRDIKPENVFINENGDFKLGDFGIAKKLEDASASLSQKGTFNYMAPEIINSIDYDARVDIYSLGILLYRMLNDNRLPFVDTEKQLLSPNDRKTALERRMKGEKLPAPKSATPEVSDIILKACAYEPNERYRTAKELKTEFEEVMKKNNEEVTATVSETGKKGNTFNTASIILSFVAIVVIGICASFMAYQIGFNSAQKNEGTDKNVAIVSSATDMNTGENQISEDSKKVVYDDKLSDAYLIAMNTFKEKKYNEAKELFMELGDYSDSLTMIQECDYQKAISVLKSGDYGGAKYLFECLGDYKETASMIKNCDYEKAVSNIEFKNYEAAKSMFAELGDYKDSKYMMTLCDFEHGCDLIRQADYDEAAKYLFRCAENEEWLEQYAKGYGGGSVATDESANWNGEYIHFDRRVRYWNNGNCGVIIDYVDEDDIPEQYTFRVLKEGSKDASDGYGFFEYDLSGKLLEAWILDN